MSADPIPAATLVLMRPSPRGPELLMTERAAGMAFAPGALVFPGGRIDPDDRVLGGGDDAASNDDERAARVAAIRETLEETGISVAMDPAPDATLESELRGALHEGARLSDLLGRHSLALRPDDLVPFARWCPTFKEARNFDTRFYLAHAPAGARAASTNAESVRAFWATAADVLARADAGDAHIIFPTRRNLERLARFGSHEDAVADAVAHPPTRIVPWIERRGDADWLCIPEGQGYPVTAEPMDSVRRG